MTKVNKWKKVKLLSLKNKDSVQTASDDYQFVIVDGRGGNPASRIIVDRDGNLRHSTIGLRHPSKKPETVNVKLTSRNDEGTLMPRGNVLMICYTYVNDQEEESNPSPVLVVDDIQYQAKGHYTKDGEIYYYPIAGGTYVYTQDKVGSIDSIVLNVPIDNAEVKRVNVYIADAEYVESSIPPSPYRLIASQIIREGQSFATMVIASARSPVEVSHENDMAAKGDAITLIDGITFIGNAVKCIGLTGEPEKVWAITLSNKNKYNYINRWLRLDLLDEAGIKPIGEQIFNGLNWSEEEKSKFRLMDSDLITPLECYHYPLDAQLKMHREIFVAGDATRATTMLLFHGSLLPSVLTVFAKKFGETGNELSLNLDIGTTVGEILCDISGEIPGSPDGLANDKIIMMSAPGIYNVVADIKEASGTKELALDVEQDGDRYTIEITPKSTDGEAKSTAKDIYELISVQMLSGGKLDGIISDVHTTSNETFNDDYVPEAQTIYFKNTETYATGSDKTTVWLAYDSLANEGNGAILSKVANVANAINNLVGSKIYATAHFGSVLATPYPEVFLSGGTGIAPVNPSDTIQTRMHCFVRIPRMLSFQEKTIYLVKFKDEPTDVECPLVEMSSLTTQDGISINNFYEQKLVKNPLYGEGDIATTREVSPEIIQDDFAKRNAANIFFDGLGLYNEGTTRSITNNQIDEYCRKSEGMAEYPWAVHDNNSEAPHLYHNYAMTGATFPRTGCLAGRFALEPAKLIGEPYIMTSEINSNGTPRKKNLIGMGYYRYLPAPTKLCLYIYDKGGALTSIPIEWVPLSDLTGDISVILSWRIDSEKTEAIEISLAVSDGDKYYYGKEIAEVIMDETKIIALFYAANLGVYPYSAISSRLMSLRKDMFIDNEWQALNMLKFLSFYPTEGIGVYDEFRENTDDTISVVNKNVDIQTVSFKQDLKPGRIQWGAYGAMPDLNEYNINEDIMALVPIKSFQPTDEHNTIVVFTKTNTYIFALLGKSARDCSLTKIISGIGIVNRRAFCTTNSGVAWLSHRGVMLLTGDGTRNISEGIVNTSGITGIVYDRIRNWIWARGENETLVYQEDKGVWWKYSGDASPDGFIGDINGKNGWICNSDNTIYVDSEEPSETKIKTRALSTVKKLSRITLAGKYSESIIKMKAKMYSNKIAGMTTETNEVNAQTNSPTAIPGVSADYVQLELSDATDIAGAKVEYEDGLK